MKSLICKVMAFFLAITLMIVGADWKILCCAEDEFTEVKINAVVNSIPQKLDALQDQQGTLYLSTDVLSEITVYQYNNESMKFVHDASDGSMDYREVWTFAEEGIQIVNFSRGMINIQKEIAIPACPEYNGKRYFPLAELLPVLNANALVEDGCLYVEDVKHSMTNIMASFDIDDYLFDMYDDDDFLGLSSAEILSGWSYLFKTLLGLEWKRLTFTYDFNYGVCDDYEEIFTEYLREDAVYMEALSLDESRHHSIINYVSNEEYEDNSNFSECIGTLSDLLEMKYEGEIPNYGKIASFASMEITQGLEYYTFLSTYLNHVDDHYEMLRSVYGFDNHIVDGIESFVDGNEERAAALNVYSKYGENETDRFASALIDQYDHAAQNVITGKTFPLTALTASVSSLLFDYMEFAPKQVADNCQYLGHYNKIMVSACQKFNTMSSGHSGMDYQTIEDTRLSAILALNASRSIYQALLGSEQAYGNSGGVYQRKIDVIDEMLKKLYLAKNACLTDSEGYIDGRVQELNYDLPNVETYDKNYEENIQVFDKAIFGAVTNALALAGPPVVTDADGDGKLELTLSTIISDSEWRTSVIMVENVVSPGMYGYTSTGAAQYIGYDVDDEKGIVLFNNNYGSVGHTWISYSCWTGSSWETVSEYLREFVGTEVEPTVTKCYWNHETVTENEFHALSDKLNHERDDLPQLLNAYIDGDLANASEQFYAYLKTCSDVQSPIAVDIDKNGTAEQVIVVNNLTAMWRENTVFFNESGTEDFTGFDNVKSTVFVLDEHNGRVRIRSENFDREISLSVVDGSIVVNNDTNLSLEYSAEEDTLETNLLKIVSQNQIGAFNEVPIAELEQIAEELYLANGHAVVSCYTYCDWETDYDDQIPSEYEWAIYCRIKGCNSMEDVLEIIHQTFSSRYDDYNRGETSGDPREEGACAVTECLSEERGLFKEMNGKVYVLCGDSPYYVSNASATYQRTEGDEVWFTMSTDRPNRTFTADFSMVYEDGVWKMGAATYARY